VTTFEEFGAMLDDIAVGLPDDLYRELNGGIVLLHELKMHPECNETGDLFILGEYHNDRKGYGGLGRYITIYYGSFMRVYPHYSPEDQKKELRRILIHEFTHHLESLAGERDLEIEDARDLAVYKQRYARHVIAPRRYRLKSNDSE